MTLQTWKAEFYPIPADHPEATASDESALLHSIRKWEGLTPENLQKHKVGNHNKFHDRVEGVDGKFIIDSDSCALCERSIKRRGLKFGQCHNCPIFIHNQQTCEDEYGLLIDFNDPNPMLELLTTTLKRLREVPHEPRTTP